MKIKTKLTLGVGLLFLLIIASKSCQERDLCMV